MGADRQPTLWDELNPLWMFRCRPVDFCWFEKSICPGVFWLPGMVALLALHAASFQGCWLLWQVGGGWALLSLLPLGILWGWFVTADIKFRWQRPSRLQRSGFDNAVVNWFGFAATLAVYLAVLPAAVLALLWWWLA
jgi:hypothetical protein